METSEEDRLTSETRFSSCFFTAMVLSLTPANAMTRGGLNLYYFTGGEWLFNTS